MFAIIEESGGQRRVQQGDTILVDLIDGGEAKPGKSVTFDRVLLIAEPGAEQGKIGTPYVAGAKVTAEVVDPLVQGEKIHIMKYREKKNQKRKTGHRQTYTRVKVTAIAG